ncbi:hypothetical protein B296_00011486, partial [Ensete ventricosum]
FSSFSLPWLRSLEIGRRQSKLIVIDRFCVVTDRNNRYLALSPGSGRFAYRSAGEPVRIARYGALPPCKASLGKG